MDIREKNIDEIFKFQTKLLQAFKDPQNNNLLEDLKKDESKIDSFFNEIKEKESK